MVTVSIINYKGGVGKTTLTANLACELAYRGYNILTIDLDPQCSLTFSFLKPDDWKNNLAENKTIKNWFKPAKKAPVSFDQLIINVTTEFRGKLDLISSHLELINIDLELAATLGGANLKQSKQRFLNVHSRLLHGINELAKDQYDYVFIDCPPNFNIVTKNAIVACDKILIPAKPDYLSTLGIDYLIRSFNGLIKEYNDYCEVEDEEAVGKINPMIAGVVFTMVQFYGGQPISASRLFIENVKTLDIPVFQEYLRENKSIFADAPLYGTPVVITSRYRTEIANELAALVDEFEAIVKPKKYAEN